MFLRNHHFREIIIFEHKPRGIVIFEEKTFSEILFREIDFIKKSTFSRNRQEPYFSAKIYFWAQSYCHGLQPGDSYLATIYDGGINSWLNAKMQEWIQDGDHVSH